MKKHLFLGLTLLAIGCGEVSEPPPEALVESLASLSGDVQAVKGDSLCPLNQYLMPIARARAYPETVCEKLAEGDVVRLEGGGSIERTQSTGGCVIQDRDDRLLTSSFCVPQPPPPYFKSQGDGICPAGSPLMTVQTALARRTELCSFLGRWDIVRLAAGGSMVGSGYGCVIRYEDTQPMGWSLCENTGITFTRVAGDGPCAPGQALLTPQEARARQSALCGTLTRWAIMRLSGGGTMRGPGYGCAISDWAPSPVGESLCKSL